MAQKTTPISCWCWTPWRWLHQSLIDSFASFPAVATIPAGGQTQDRQVCAGHLPQRSGQRHFINACNGFQFLSRLPSGASPGFRKQKSSEDNGAACEAELLKQIESILDDHNDEEIFASELKGILLRLRPDFNEKNYGCATFGKLLSKLSQKYDTIRVRSDNYNVMVSLAADAAEEGKAAAQLTRDNWIDVFREQLKHYKEDGFERINPSILKADIQGLYPDFQEKNVGFKRFSDLLKELEKEKVLALEMDQQKNMLIKML